MLESLTNFVTFDTRRSGRELFQKLLAHGVIVRPLDPYRMPSFLRVSVGTPAENDAFLAALDSVFSQARSMRANGLVVAIDGPSGAGKSTAGRALAVQLGYTYIDTGAMYRALALKASRSGVSLDAEEALAALLRASSIALAEGGRRVLLDTQDVTTEARSRETSRASSLVSVHPGVRVEMVARQREMGKDGGVVLDGRDIGTAVFPDAEVKFFLDADPAVRAQRRLGELRAAGNDVSFDSIEKEVRERDYTDTHRAESPLQRAWDAIALDTTKLSHEEVVERMLAAVRAREGRPVDLARLAEVAPPLAAALPRGAANRQAQRRHVQAAPRRGGPAAPAPRGGGLPGDGGPRPLPHRRPGLPGRAGRPAHGPGPRRARLPLDHGRPAAAGVLRAGGGHERLADPVAGRTDKRGRSGGTRSPQINKRKPCFASLLTHAT